MHMRTGTITRSIGIVAIAMIAAIAMAQPPGQPTTELITQPATQPAAQPATQPAIDISPAAQTLLAAVRDAYVNVQSLDLAGTFTLDTDAAGFASKKSADFTAAFAAPSKVRHEM